MNSKILLFSLLLVSSLCSWIEAQYHAIRVIRGEKYEYQTAQYNEIQMVLDGLKNEKVKFKKIGEYKSDAEAKKAIRSDADKVGYFTCWRCEGGGMVVPESEYRRGGRGREGEKADGEKKKRGQNKGEEGAESRPSNSAEKTKKCEVCRGKKRIKSAGFLIVKIEGDEFWTYVLIRKSMLPILQKYLKRASKRSKMVKAPKSKTAKAFKPGQFDEAQELYNLLMEKSSQKKGFQKEIPLPMFKMPKLTLPEEFFIR